MSASTLREFRETLGAALGAALGKGWAVFPDAGAIDDPQKPTVVLSRQRVAKLTAAPMSDLQSELTLHLIYPEHTSEGAEDDYLDALLDALQGLNPKRTTWSEATRGNFGELHAYQIPLTIHHRRKADS